MNLHQRILHTLSTLLMVLSVCELVVGGLFAASGLRGFNNTDALDADVVSELASIGADPAGAALALAAFGAALALCGIIMLPVGVLDRRSAKTPRRSRRLWS